MSSDEEISKEKHKNEKEFKFKLAWQEDPGKWSTARGDGFYVSGSILFFSGSHGLIVLSPGIDYVIK